MATRRQIKPSTLIQRPLLWIFALFSYFVCSRPGWLLSWPRRPEAPKEHSGRQFTVTPGTRIPLSLINSVSTKSAAEGDRVYLETVFPIVLEGKVVIPPGSYVAGTITQVKRPGRVKGRGELYLRFDSLTLPNGVTRDFRARVGALDGRATEDLDKAEGKIRSEGNKGGDAQKVGEAAAAGASVGAIAGSVCRTRGNGRRYRRGSRRGGRVGGRAAFSGP